MRNALLVTLSLIMVVFAGCLGGGQDAGDDASPTPTGGNNGDGNQTNGDQPAPQAPQASLRILENGTALAPVNESFPVTAGADITLDASRSADPDGENLTFAWNIDGADAGADAQIVVNFTEGLHEVLVTVTDDDQLTDSARATVNATSAGPMFLFFDGAESPAEWTFDSKIFFSLNLGQGEERTLDEEHPEAAGWHTTTADYLTGTAAWTMQDEEAGGYHDHEWVSMVSPEIDLSGVSAATLSFFMKGDSEANNKDGVYWAVSADGGESWTELGMQSGLVADWTQFTADLSEQAGGTIQIRLLFLSDASCSMDTNQADDFCGAGEYLGFWVDDIAVAA